MKTPQKFYKVVNIQNATNSLTSAVISHFRSICVFYKLNKWVWPTIKGSKLFVFDNLKDAVLYKSEMDAAGDYRIYECEVKKVFQPQSRAYNHDYDADVLLFWRHVNRSNKKLSKPAWPVVVFVECLNGTVWTNAVKLVRLVPPEEYATA